MTTEVSLGDGESVERLISRFRQRVLKKGILKQTRKNRFHVRKPARRVLKEKAIRREQKRAESEQFHI